MAKHKWEFTVGDRSHDGHGLKDTFVIESNLTVAEAREAYHKAKKKFKKAYPEVICSDYEDGSVEYSMLQELRLLGFEFENCDGDGEEGEEDEVIYPSSEGMLQLTMWCIKQGNPEFKYKLINNDLEEFGGYGPGGDYISFIGYGTFSS